jgi:hypothetical protein
MAAVRDVSCCSRGLEWTGLTRQGWILLIVVLSSSAAHSVVRSLSTVVRGRKGTKRIVYGSALLIPRRSPSSTRLGALRRLQHRTPGINPLQLLQPRPNEAQWTALPSFCSTTRRGWPEMQRLGAMSGTSARRVRHQRLQGNQRQSSQCVTRRAARRGDGMLTVVWCCQVRAVVVGLVIGVLLWSVELTG